MRTNIEIDDKLMKKVLRVSGERTKRAQAPVVHRGAGAHLDGTVHAWSGALEDREDYGAGERA